MSNPLSGPPPEYVQTLAELGSRLIQGDSEVLRDVLLLLGAPAERAVRRHLGSSLADADYEDALSIALFRLWKRRDRFDPSRARLDRWFYLLVRNAAIDLVRNKQRRHEQTLGDEAETIPASTTDRGPELRSRLREDLQRALSTVSEVDQRILISGLTETELSRELDMTPGAIRVRRLRTKRRLQTVLINMGHVVPKK